ncbi:MAG: hypothetical protein AAFR76_03650 [Planctomycetota bacterium]
MSGERVNPEAESDRLLRRSLAEMERGETIPAEEVFKQLAEEPSNTTYCAGGEFGSR